MRPFLACAAIGLLAVPLGCGGGAGETTPAAVLSGLDRGAFVDRADRICAQGRKRLILAGNRYFGDLPVDRDPSDAAATASRTARRSRS